MGVNLFALSPISLGEINATDVDTLVKLANSKAKGRFDWCNLFKGPGGCLLTMQAALAFEPEAAPYWVLLHKRMYTVKTDAHWRQLLTASGCKTVVFMKAIGGGFVRDWGNWHAGLPTL